MNRLISDTVASLAALKANLVVYDDPDLTISMVRRLARKGGVGRDSPEWSSSTTFSSFRPAT